MYFICVYLVLTCRTIEGLNLRLVNVIIFNSNKVRQKGIESQFRLGSKDSFMYESNSETEQNIPTDR